MYRIDGVRCLTERELGHLEGYRGSRPVRIGNEAATQLQLDVYGELFDSIYLAERQALSGSRRADRVRRLDEPGAAHRLGLRALAGARRRHLGDPRRAQALHPLASDVLGRDRPRDENRDEPRAPCGILRWTRARDDIFAWIMARGWSERRQAFVQAEGSDVLDASLLLMPLVHFIAPTDPRWLSTLRAIGSELVSDSLVHRYDPAAAPDGLEGDEGTFSMCSFWYVECLARAGYLEEAQLAFEKMLTYANHLGLYSEQIGSSGELLGNFPQAFTHLALISAAIRLDRELQT